MSEALGNKNKIERLKSNRDRSDYRYAEVLVILLLSWTQADPKEPKLPQASRSICSQPAASVLTTILNLFTVFSPTQWVKIFYI